MLKIGGVILGQVPRVVFAVSGDSPAAARAAIQGVDLLEARIDRFSTRAPAVVMRELKRLRRHGLPLIGTVRTRAEGGSASITETERTTLYTVIAPWVDAIDVDLRASHLKAVVSAARRHRATVILSYHDFRHTPVSAALERVLRRASSLGADLIKVAALARDERDVARLLAFTLRHRHQGLVTAAMGAPGTISRLMFPLAGSLLTYTSVPPRDGQLPTAQLIEELRRYYPAYRRALARRHTTPRDVSTFRGEGML